MAEQNSPDENKTVQPDQTVLSKPELTRTVKDGDTVEDGDPGKIGETLISSPDAANAAAANEQAEDASGDPEATFVSNAVPADDGTVFKAPNKRGDLEDYYETLVEDTQSPADSPDQGGFIIGDYQVIDELGRGGMGVVYRARHRKLNREVALKMILAGDHAGPDALQRFITEARAVAHLQHPNIVQIFDIGEHNGLPFFSLEFVDGTDLQKHLAGTPQDAVEAAKLVEKLARAMHYAHENNILHRDIKPPNVLLDANGEPKITDFGLAKHVEGSDATATQAGTIMGSPSYMPPEQARGDVSSVTPRSDLYSLGAVLYEMLTGRPPFLAKRPLETVMQVVNNECVPPRQLQPEIPVDIDTICMKALQKEQHARYQSCKELAEDLRRFINGEPILARPIGRLERAWKWCKRNPRIAVPSGLAMFGIIATAVIASWAWQATSALAADLRVEKDKVTEQRDEAEKQKVIAQNQRNEAEKQKAIAVVNEQKAIAAKDEADKQRALAEEARKRAEENAAIARKQSLVALKSIQFVLTKVDSELQSRPQLSDVRLALLESLSDKWDEINVELAGGDQGEAAATLMAVRKNIAEIYADLDKVDLANEEYAKLYEAGKKRVEVKGHNDASRYNLAQICLGWAPIRKRALNDPGEALRLHEEAIALMKDMIENPRPEPGSPGPIQIQAATAQVIQNAGVEYLRSGLVEKTAEKWADALKINKRLLAAIPNAAEFEGNEGRRAVFQKYFSGEVDRGHVALGYIQLRRGKTDEALQLYKTGIEGSRAKLLAQPDDVQAKASLGGYLDMLGEAYLWLKRPADAEAPLREAQRILKDAYETDPGVARIARSYGNNQYHLATLADLQSKPDEKKKWAAASRDLFAELVKKAPDRKNKIMLMLAEAKLGNAEAARPIIDELGKTDKPDTEAHLDRSRALAQLSRAANDDESKQKLIGDALTAIERCVKDGYSDPFRLTHDNDLEPLQNEARFQALIAKLTQK